MIFPNEKRFLQDVTVEVRDELDTCRMLLDFGANLPGEKDDLHKGSLRHDTVSTAIAFFVKVSTSFRAVIHLCEAGLDRNAMPVSRSLFETTVTLTFLVRQRVSLYRFYNKQKPKTPLELFGKKLTTEFRTELYHAWCILWEEKVFEQWQKTPGIKQAAKQVLKKISKSERPYVDSIGQDWVKQIKGKNTCVGLGILDFAESLGASFHRWYRTVYAGDSQHVHQSDAMSYLIKRESKDTFSPRWFTSAADIRNTLLYAATIYLLCVAELDKRFRFGASATERIGQFNDKIGQWSTT